MTETQQRLIRCFRAVFPELRRDDEALHASASSVGAWDSMGAVILVAAVEEEFGVQIEPEQIEKFTSFASYLQWLTDGSRTAARFAGERIAT